MFKWFKERRRKAKLAEEARVLSPQLLRQVNESVDLINSTTNPDTFFFRYDFLVKRLKELVVMEEFINFTGEKPSVALSRIIVDRPDMIDSFLYRYYESALDSAIKLKTIKGRANRVEKFQDSMKLYEDKMEESNINYLEELVVRLKDELGLLVKEEDCNGKK